VADEPTPAEQAFRAHRRQIYSFLLRKTGDPSEAEELTQSVFAAATVALAMTDTTPRSLLGWLYAVADRRFIDEIRRRARDERFVAMNPPMDAPVSEYGAAVASAIKRAVERLPDEQRRLVVMKVLEGRSFRELAERFGITEAACKMRFSRAIKLVQKSLEDEGYKP
jgi:RNA polymerase sigma-70 factor, ECF subfamily